MTKIQKIFKKLLKIPNILYNLLKNITFQILWTKKGTKTLLLGLENDWKGTIRPEAYFIISSIRNIIGQEEMIE